MAVTFNTFPQGSNARITAVDQHAVKYGNSVGNIPRRLLVFGSPTDGKDLNYNIPKRMFSIADTLIYGEGSELTAMLKTAFLYNPNIEIHAMPVQAKQGKQAEASIKYSGTSATSGEINYYIAGQKITVKVMVNDSASKIAETTVARIMDNVDLPCTAEIDSVDTTSVNLKAKWKGETSNQIKLVKIDSEGNAPSGVLVTVNSFSLGAGTISAKNTFENFGDTWFTMLALPFSDTENLNDLKELSEKLISAVEVKAFQYFVGKSINRESYREFVSKRNDKHLAAMFVENSLSPDYIIAASAATYIENAHSESPTASYSSPLKNVVPSIEIKRMEFSEKDAILKLGGCTTEVRADGLAYFENTVTTYKKNNAGATDDSWRYPQVMAAYQEVSHQVKLRFMMHPFDRAVVVNDASITSSPFAVRPLQVKSTMKDLIKNFESNAIIRSVEESLKTVVCEIDKNNAGRINYKVCLFFALPLEQKAFMFEWSTETIE